MHSGKDLGPKVMHQLFIYRGAIECELDRVLSSVNWIEGYRVAIECELDRGLSSAAEVQKRQKTG
jgi:hypothetical protein